MKAAWYLMPVAALLVLASYGALADSYKIDWNVASCGGDNAQSTNFRVSGTVGQPVANFAAGGGGFHWMGFWSSDLPAPTAASSAGAAKIMLDGSFVSISGQIATSDGGDFGNCFYVEEPTCVSGIRISTPPGAVSGLTRGSSVSVVGSVGTSSTGEAEIVSPLVNVLSTGPPLRPLGMSNGTLGGGARGLQPEIWDRRLRKIPDSSPPVYARIMAPIEAPNNVGLLVSTWGAVTYKGTGFFYLDDGSGVDDDNRLGSGGQPIIGVYVAAPYDGSIGDFVFITGISSSQHDGENRFVKVIRARDPSDVISMPR